MPCEIAFIKNPAGTGRRDCVRGEASVVKPLGNPWSPIERAEYEIVVALDLTVAEAQDLYCKTGTPDAAAQAEIAEIQRHRSDCTAARLAAAAVIEDAGRAAELDAAQKIDLGFPVKDVLTETEKAVLTTKERKDLTVARLGREARAAADQEAIKDVAPIDPATKIAPYQYPTRLRHIDIDALDGKPKTAEELAAITTVKEVA